MKEKTIQDNIRLALSEIAVTFRANVGFFYTKDGRQIATGLPNGFSDLFGFRKSDGKMFFVEVKKENGKASKEQLHFIDTMNNLGANAGIARSPEEAIEIVQR